MSSAEQKVLTTSLDADTLDTTLSILQTASQEARLHLGSDGLSAKVVDPANVMMVDLELSPSAFTHTPDGSYTVGVNLERLRAFVSRAGSGQVVDFSFRPQTRELNITYNNVDADMACIDPDAIRGEPSLPDIDLPNHATLDTSALDDALYHADLVSDHVGFRCDADEDVIEVTAEGDTDDVDVTLDADDFDEHHIRKDTLSWYSMDYLYSTTGSGDYGKAVKTIPDGEVTLSLGDEWPTIMDYGYADGYGEVSTLLAPRIDTR